MSGMSHKNNPVRLAALAAGLNTFEVDRPCPAGHFLRHVSNGTCVACTKLADDKRREEARLARTPGVPCGQPKPVKRNITLKDHPARLAALAAGEKYFAAESCSRNHISARYVSTGECVQCGAEKYREKHPKKPKQPTTPPRQARRAIGKRTYAENQRRAELEAGLRRELLGDRETTSKQLGGWLTRNMNTDAARGRGQYLDRKIKDGENFIRRGG
jgi:hypothetical protein